MIRFYRSRPASILVGLATSAFANTALAQGATISGTVKSTQGQALEAASVRIAELNVALGTDKDGTYLIRLAPERVRGQVVTLSVRAIGYKPQSKQITIGTGMQDHDFALEYDVNRVSEVVVTDAQVDTVRRNARKQLAFTVDKGGYASSPASSDFSQHLFPPELIMQHQARLKLTEQQRDGIVAEINKLQATATQVQWRVGDESEKLAELLRRETVSEADVLAQAERLITQETAVKRAQLSMLIRIRNILTPEQREILQYRRRFPGTP
jgi:Spy/CpxP family protein refolding chaperone